jgi:hypothetical protein
MRRFVFASVGVAMLAGTLVHLAPASGQADGEASPIYGVKIPAGFREWSLINVAHEAADLNDFRVVLGNAIAIHAFQEGRFPSRTVRSLRGWRGSTCRRTKTTRSLAGSNLSLPGHLQILSSWSRIQENIRRRAAGDSPNSQTADPTTRRCTKRASHATSPRKGTIWFLRATHLRPEVKRAVGIASGSR